MTSFRIEEFPLDPKSVLARVPLDSRYANWPVVYTLLGANEIYVGESLNVAGRLRQHMDSASKQRLSGVRVVLDSTFNKSVCLDLESYLIRLLAGDGKYQVLNRNDGITNADYYGRAEYQQTFDAIFEELRSRGVFTRGVPEIVNTDLFKLSPFKALTADQAIALEDILNGLFEDMEAGKRSQVVIDGDPGTGKTIVGVYLMKLLKDIEVADPSLPTDRDSLLSEFFVEGYAELLRGFRVALVVPQQSLRKSIQKVFRRTPGLDPAMVVTPFDVGTDEERFDLLIVDETHRLNQRANQSSGSKNIQFASINQRLYGADDPSLTQLDWITAMSDHQIFLLDAAQTVRPADLGKSTVDALVRKAGAEERRYRLVSQMRVGAGDDYVGYIRGLLSDRPPMPAEFHGYDLRLFGDLGAMRRAVARKEREGGLARLVAGYAWPWRSKADPTAFDIEIDDVKLRWNSTDVDWVGSAKSVEEVGSIHTIQGYDLNYAGVIVGPDLSYDPTHQRLAFNRASYFDTKGKENNPKLGIVYTDEDLLRFVENIYAVLLTRGIRGTYVYACDPALHDYLAQYLPVEANG